MGYLFYIVVDKTSPFLIFNLFTLNQIMFQEVICIGGLGGKGKGWGAVFIISLIIHESTIWQTV